MQLSVGAQFAPDSAFACPVALTSIGSSPPLNAEDDCRYIPPPSSCTGEETRADRSVSFFGVQRTTRSAIGDNCGLFSVSGKARSLLLLIA